MWVVDGYKCWDVKFVMSSSQFTDLRTAVDCLLCDESTQSWETSKPHKLSHSKSWQAAVLRSCQTLTMGPQVKTSSFDFIFWIQLHFVFNITVFQLCSWYSIGSHWKWLLEQVQWTDISHIHSICLHIHFQKVNVSVEYVCCAGSYRFILILVLLNFFCHSSSFSDQQWGHWPKSVIFY